MDTTFTALVGPEEVNIGQAALWQKGYARLQGLEEGCFLLWMMRKPEGAYQHDFIKGLVSSDFSDLNAQSQLCPQAGFPGDCRLDT